MYFLHRYITNHKYRIAQIEPSSSMGSERVDLRQVTFLIPVRIEHPDRERNLNLTIDYLNARFQTNIIVGEDSSYPQLQYLADRCKYYHYPSNDPYTYKTKTLNQLAKVASTPIVAIWDTDALVATQQIVAASQAIERDSFDLVYPYSGVFLDLPQSNHQEVIDRHYRLDLLSPSLFQPNQGNSIGGAIFFNRDVFMRDGMMNENFKSYGWEDDELIERFFKLGAKIARIRGELIHLQHYRGQNSSVKNLFAKTNQQELLKIKKMNRSALRDYVNTFSWLDNRLQPV